MAGSRGEIRDANVVISRPVQTPGWILVRYAPIKTEKPLSQQYEFLGKTLSGPFTIPSGIVATAVPIIEYLFRHVPQVGVMTTKSIGPVPRAGNREPIMTQYAPGCFMNAVGLTNPGAEEAAAQLGDLVVPDW